MSNQDQSGGPDDQAISRLNDVLNRQPSKPIKMQLERYLEEAAIIAVNSIAKDVRDVYCEIERLPMAPNYCRLPIRSKALDIFLLMNTALNQKLENNRQAFIEKLGV